MKMYCALGYQVGKRGNTQVRGDTGTVEAVGGISLWLAAGSNIFVSGCIFKLDQRPIKLSDVFLVDEVF